MKIPFILEIQPGAMLIIGLLLMLLMFWIFWPKRGLLALLSKLKINNQRVHLEDALKFLFDCEYKNTICNVNSIAGNLNINMEQASRLVERLISMGLITMNDEAIRLTDTGRSNSLRVIRVHRVWEKYLADETSMAPADWHNEADRLEHFVTVEDTEKLAAQMGHPVYDPHGDPIPTIDGELPSPKGKPLNQMKAGESGVIIHIEDEPKYIYEQLVVQGLYPGMQVYVIHVIENKITFAANGEEYTFTPLFAAHLTVELLSDKAPEKQKHDLLSSLSMGEEAEIAGISPHCRGQQRRRLMDLGIVPGSLIAAEIKSASGDPVGYRVMGTTIGIRKQQAEQIFIHRKKENHYESNE
ncbi:MAG: metal-dependent transcriptional regulator [Bacteroidetes bacterium]|nr:metal-dependent transcriptional regulator [Bacteroidota bacterium]